MKDPRQRETVKTARDITDEAKRRYLFDPEFHMRADLAVQALNGILPVNTPRLQGADLLAATYAAATALVVAELPVEALT